MSLSAIPGTPSDHLTELEEFVGERIHIVRSSLALTRLAELGDPATVQPRIDELVMALYSTLIEYVMGRELPVEEIEQQTRMFSLVGKAEGSYRGPAIRRDTKVVCAEMARAGTLPSIMATHLLWAVLDQSGVRRDFLASQRTTGENGEITGATVSVDKIGGGVDGAQLWFCDPMLATGASICQALEVYRRKVGGRPQKIIVLCLVAAPTGLKRLMAETEVQVYVYRVDKRLTEKGYIVPGLGGMGEIMTNSFV